MRTEHYQGKAAAIAASQAQGLTDASLNSNYLAFILLSLVRLWVAIQHLSKVLYVNNEDALAQYRGHLVETPQHIISDRLSGKYIELSTR